MDVLTALDGCCLADHMSQTDVCHRPPCNTSRGEKQTRDSTDEDNVTSKRSKVVLVEHQDMLDKSPGSKDSGAEDCGALFDGEIGRATSSTWLENNFMSYDADNNLPDEGIHEIGETQDDMLMHCDVFGSYRVVTDDVVDSTFGIHEQHDDYGTTDELDAALQPPPLLSTDAAFPMLDSAECNSYDDMDDVRRITSQTLVGDNAMLAGDTAMLPEHDVEEQFLRSLPQIMTSGDSVASGLAELGDQLLLPSLQGFDDIAFDSPVDNADDIPCVKSHSDCRTPRRCKIKTDDPYGISTANAELLIQETVSALDECLSEDSIARRLSLKRHVVPVRRRSEQRRSFDGSYNLRLVRRRTSVCPCCGGLEGISAEQLSAEFKALHSLRRTVTRLLDGVFPQLPCPPSFSAESPAVDKLVDDVTSALRGNAPPSAVDSNASSFISQPTVTLCAQPGMCLRSLHDKTQILLSLLTISLQLNTDDSGLLSHLTTGVMHDDVIL